MRKPDGSRRVNLKAVVTTLLLSVVAVFCFATQSSPPYAIATKTQIIHAGTLLPLPGDKPRVRQTIVIRNGKIDTIADGYLSRHDVAGDDSNEVIINLRQYFVMPGLIDLHVHISWEISKDAKMYKVTRSDADNALTAAMYAKRTLNSGFTTLRDLGSSGEAVFALRDAVKVGKVPGPRLLVAGDPISATGGHGDIHGFRPKVLDALRSTGTCDGPNSCRAAVRRQVKRGADVIKVTVTGGVSSEIASGVGQQLTDDELKAIVEAAHSLGRKVTAHAHSKVGVEAALRAGFDSIEHGTWADRDTMKLFNETGAWLLPTIYPITAAGDTPEKLRKGPYSHVPLTIMEKIMSLGKKPREMTRLAHSMGVNIALGSDAGTYYHGENANEIVELVKIGMSPMQALAAATINAAVAGGIENYTGSLEPSKAADIIAMPGNPLDDINVIFGVNFVMRDGVIFRNDSSIP